jgi:hypothetical protein
MPSRTARFAAIFALLAAAPAPPAAADPTDTLWGSPVIGGRALSRDWAGCRLFAQGEGFSIGRRSAGYGLEGGAALSVVGRLGLTAGFRLMGFARGDRLGAQLDDVASRSLAPILGLDFEF